VKNLIETHHVELDDETFNKIYPIVEKYISDLKTFLKTN
jgi:DNA-directed RNA polymerase subunit F